MGDAWAVVGESASGPLAAKGEAATVLLAAVGEATAGVAVGAAGAAILARSMDFEPDQNLNPSSDSPEIEDQGHHPQPGRQKASAHLQPFHPPTVIAKLCSTAFKKNSRRILEFVEIMQCPWDTT